MTTPLASRERGSGGVDEVIRPAAIVPEESARTILSVLEQQSVDRYGYWQATPREWSRYDTAGVDAEGAPVGALIGRIEAVYGAATRYDVTIHRVIVTPLGTDEGWTVERLCDEPLSYGGLSLATCPRAELSPPPKPFRF